MVTVEDHAPQKLKVAAGTAGLRVEMTRGGSVGGRVLLPDGTAAKSANVSATGPAGSGNARTDADGHYSIKGLAEGTYSLQVWVYVAGAASRGSANGVEVREGAATDVPDIKCEAQPMPKAPAPPMPPRK
jgi:hypothetical protein